MTEHEPERMMTDMQPNMAHPIPAARPLTEFAWERIGDDLIVFDGETMQYHTLNTHAVEVWAACDGTASIASIAQMLQLPVEIVEATIEQLGEVGLLQIAGTGWDSTVNRRHVTKLIAAGLTGAVGLPVIKSITAPDSAAAISQNQCTYYSEYIPCTSFGCQIVCFWGYRSGGSCQSITSGPGIGNLCCVCGGSVMLTSEQIDSATSGRFDPASYGQPMDQMALPAAQEQPELIVAPADAEVQTDESPAVGGDTQSASAPVERSVPQDAPAVEPVEHGTPLPAGDDQSVEPAFGG